jgi:hypothetical protein
MIYFVLTREGYEELVSRMGRAPSPLWVNYGVLSEAELAQLRDAGSNVTNFTSRVSPNVVSEIQDALSTIQEHHPKHRIWVEYVSGL